MDKLTIIGTGLSGMIGSTITRLLSNRYSFEDLSFDTGVDIRNKDVVYDRIKKSDARVVIHMAAKADVDGCEDDKQEDMKNLQDPNEIIPVSTLDWNEWKKRNTAFAINVGGTKNMAEACKALGKKLVYISTDYVFDGGKETLYEEEDVPHPINWYGATKYWGEEIMKQSHPNYCIVRLAFPYGATSTLKKDFVQSIVDRLKHGKTVRGVVDQQFTPTYIPDIASAFDILIQKNATGIYHVAGSTSLSSYDAVVAIANQFGYDTSLLAKTTISEFFRERAPRPKRTCLSNGKIHALGVVMKSFEEGLREITQEPKNLRSSMK